MTERGKMRLFHGGHKGAESAFGRAADRWDVPEVTVSYKGHVMEFAKNVDELSDEQLERGHVSMDFVFQRMGRRFASGTGLRRVIYSMFHVVTRGDELFAIGWIQPDGSVKGGTGWAVELARMFNRPVHVFDQEENGWFSWTDQRWHPSEPKLPNRPFAASGTRSLTDAGRKAIEALFERTLGPAPR